MSNSLPPGWGQSGWSGDPGRQPGGAWSGDEQRVLGYAGFWVRTAAALIDGMLVTVAGFLLQVLAVPSVRFDTIEVPGGDTPSYEVAYRTTDFFYSVPFPHPHIDTSGSSPLFLLLPLAYSILLEASTLRGTIGKWILGLQVCDLDGRRISLLRSLVRNVVKSYISFPFLLIGVLMVAFTPKKQGLHDMVASTLVVRRQRIVQFNRRY
ncbi:RDD family protein [Acetobacter fallax]|uniref:RDD family protein n=1 Tax=Acetobacter fallax TaxID=1737473 RepID=A0ABX0KC38_9PROT|nr:RDD family protein [Acetobacter fallax]NHO33545.1 RDD family protein [Acetobacter fallax]NHO36514.1 RDD family protein [Acetobacter fallax]